MSKEKVNYKELYVHVEGTSRYGERRLQLSRTENSESNDEAHDPNHEDWIVHNGYDDSGDRSQVDGGHDHDRDGRIVHDGGGGGGGNRTAQSERATNGSNRSSTGAKDLATARSRKLKLQ